MNAPLASMTGYARAAGEAAGFELSIEIKSVNARGLDMRMRLPSGFDGAEPELRRLIAARLDRGAVTVNVGLKRQTAGSELVVNETALTAVLGALKTLAEKTEAAPPSLDGILGLPGILELQEADLSGEAGDAVMATLIQIAETCLSGLETARRGEGAKLAEILTGQIAGIENLTGQADAHPARSREVILEKLREQIAELTEASPALSEERLYQEAMLLAAKADIREELDRLRAHCAAARQLLKSGGPVGRKLDFLAQEFNREANTLCSKSNAVDLTAIGLDLKAVIDQLREQVANIE
jgi:uncharacterized protein (TIGR00255 family)